MASASPTWFEGQFQANSHWSLEDNASAVFTFSAWVASSWVSWVDEMWGEGGNSLAPLLVLLVLCPEVIGQCRDLWK